MSEGYEVTSELPGRPVHGECYKDWLYSDSCHLIFILWCNSFLNTLHYYYYYCAETADEREIWTHKPSEHSHMRMVTHIARVWINLGRLPILLVVSWTGETNISLSPFAPENLVSRDEFGSSVPRQPAHLHTQAESGAYLRDSSRVPRWRPFIYFNRHTSSGQSRVCRVTHLHTDGVHCRECAGTGPVNLKVVPNGCCLRRSPWTN